MSASEAWPLAAGIDAPFIVFALPRSRTFWLSRLLTYGGWACAHEEARHVRGVDDVAAWLSQDMAGSVETSAAPYWRLVLDVRPDVRIAVIRRPAAEVMASLLATGIQFDRPALARLLARHDRKLDQIERQPDVLSVTYADLAQESVCARLFEHCLGLPHDPAWWAHLAPMNLQADLAALFRYHNAYAERIQAAQVACVRHIRHALLAGKVRHGATDERGVTIQEERLDTFYRDGADLFAEHCLAVGEAEDEWTRKNIPLIFQLEAGGFLQIMTARSNGRMLAYLMTLVAPSLEATNRETATQTLFFASRDARGLNLGEALETASIERLRAAGTYEVIMRAGVRGSGPRLGVLYRRLGADPCGELYRLHLGGA
jgi:GNAT superfamily N-acetyltransferase